MWRSNPLATSSSWKLSLVDSAKACCETSAASSIVSISAGNSISILSDQSDSTGESGQPASDKLFTFTSRISPFLIGKSNWLLFTSFGSDTFSSDHS